MLDVIKTPQFTRVSGTKLDMAVSYDLIDIMSLSDGVPFAVLM